MIIKSHSQQLIGLELHEAIITDVVRIARCKLYNCQIVAPSIVLDDCVIQGCKIKADILAYDSFVKNTHIDASIIDIENSQFVSISTNADSIICINSTLTRIK